MWSEVFLKRSLGENAMIVREVRNMAVALDKVMYKFEGRELMEMPIAWLDYCLI